MLDEKSNCLLCRDTGWVLAQEEGKSLARRCECFERRRVPELIKRSNIPKRYRHCTFANYQPRHESQRDALKLARQFADQFPDRSAGLLFVGKCGVGKTHLATAILNELMAKKRLDCVFYDFRDLIRDIQSTFSSDSDVSASEILAPVFQSRLLVLDELGAKRSTDWVEETIFYIINQRYNQDKTTIFTSNYPDDADREIEPVPWSKGSAGGRRDEDNTLIGRIGVRLHSRIYEMCRIVEIDGQDYRRVVQAGYQSNQGLAGPLRDPKAEKR